MSCLYPEPLSCHIFNCTQFYKGKLHYVEEELKATLEQLAHTSSEVANMSSTLRKASLAIQASLQVRKCWVDGACNTLNVPSTSLVTGYGYMYTGSVMCS